MTGLTGLTGLTGIAAGVHLRRGARLLFEARVLPHHRAVVDGARHREGGLEGEQRPREGVERPAAAGQRHKVEEVRLPG